MSAKKSDNFPSSSNRKQLSAISFPTTTSSNLLPTSRTNLNISSSLRSNSVGKSKRSNHIIKKTNSVSNLDSTNNTQLTFKSAPQSKLIKPISIDSNKSCVKTNQSLINSKFKIENDLPSKDDSCKDKNPEARNESSSQPNFLALHMMPSSSNSLHQTSSKKFGKSLLKCPNISNGNVKSDSSSFNSTDKFVLNKNESYNIDICQSKANMDMNNQEIFLSKTNNSDIPNNCEISSDSNAIQDELENLEIDKCNIHDDSDDSDIAVKPLSSSFYKLDFNTISVCSLVGNSSSQSLNQNASVHSSLNGVNLTHSPEFQQQTQNNNSLTSSFNKSLRNYNPTTSKNICHMHQSAELVNSSSSSGNSMANSYSYTPSLCCHNHLNQNHHHNQTRPELFKSVSIISHRQQQQQCVLSSKKNSLDLGMSSIQATTIISSHCNTENNTNASNSAAITKLTSSSSGLPVTTLTVMESPNLSSRAGVSNWQAWMQTLKDRMAAIFNCEVLADVHFVVGKGNSQTRFPAHKFVLSIGSAVFDAMFNGLLAKATTCDKQCTNDVESQIYNSNTEIELPDIEPEAFQALLRFLYLDEVQIGPETVMTTLYAAKKYEVLVLEMACVNFLKSNLSPENAFMLLTQARLFDETNLADLCLETIDKHTMDALCSDSFFDIDLDTLKLVLNRDTLRIREVSLFLAVLKWAEIKCSRQALDSNIESKRLVLGDALYLIRFPLMSIKEFALNVAQSGLLTDKEVVNLFLYYTVSTKPSVPFSIESRCCITGEECTINRFQRTGSLWGYSGSSDRICFSTDRPIFVIGFGLFGSIHGSSEYEALIEIIHTRSDKVLASNKTTFISDGTDSTFRVMFKYPVEIKQNTNYTACATLKGIDSFYGINGCRTVTVNMAKDEKKESVTFQFSYVAGCNNGTSVEEGQIPEIIFYTFPPSTRILSIVKKEY